MRLTRLEMQGFKSFADETVMLFDDGVTAIVGPNGCGKSNVSDAVRWVLGEQRARILRGARMEEVIFQGSSARRAVNVAEVSLVFENDDGTLPTPFREVVVTRRLSRAGESEYLLNGAACRLRDIHDLMRGTGLGADVGVVIEQRMIDALLSDRPDDRRELFEEASGIGLYRDRRRSTERRLDETTQDLARLDDLIGEVQSQVRSLARQRKRAERHAELMERRFKVDLTLASRDMASWREELSRLEAALGGLREAVPRLEERVRTMESARDEAHQTRTLADGRRHELAREVGLLREAAQELRGEIAVAEERQRNALQRRERAETERQEGQAVGSRLEGDLASLANERLELERLVDAARGDASAREIEEANAREALRQARGNLESAEQHGRVVRDQLREMEADRESADRELAELESRTRNLGVERGELTGATDALEVEIAAARDASVQASRTEREAQDALQEARNAANAARERDAEARAALLGAEDVMAALEGRLHGLEGLERERVGLAPASARLLQVKNEFGEGAILGPLSDFVSAGSGAAGAIERYLGMTIHAIVVRDGAVAEAVRAWHTRQNPGPLLLLPLDSVSGDDHDEDGDLFSQIEIAPAALGWARVLLRRVRCLDEGAFVDPRGAVWLPGLTAGPGPLRRRAELTSIRRELATAQETRQAAALASESSRSAMQRAEAAVNTATDAAHSARNQERRAQETLADLERRHARLARELSDSHAVTTQISSRMEELGKKVKEIDVRQAEARDQLVQHDASVTELREAMAAAEREMDQVRDRRIEAQVALAQSEARLLVTLDRQRRVSEEKEVATSRLATLAQELGMIDDADRSVARQLAAWTEELEERANSLSVAEVKLDEAERDVLQANRQVDDTEHLLDDARTEARRQSEELHHAELRFTELAGRRTAIRERLEAEWRRPLNELLDALQPLEQDDESLRAEARSLQEQLDALGPVNPLAIEEHDEEVKRLDFLSRQRADMGEARNALQAAIREIDATARELFLATFTQVRENFRKIFMTLFGGGECDLRLENPEAPLDCDIEIHASPRGKRTQRIHLLSSGERALVALSLLFGIFLTRPSPFCLLDEVDAPLDDANIGRFVRMLNEFKSKTQFLVITHNPRTTTEAADAVYGITMQEPGVSSVVSVRMRGPQVDDVASDDDSGTLDRSVDVTPVSEAAPASL